MSEALPLLVAIADGVARLTLNRPQAGNAIDLATARALLDAADRCDSDPDVRCVLLTGSGRLFCAGGDLALFASAGEGIGSVLSELADTLHRALIRFAGMAKPMVVLVNGPAAGAGLSLAIAGDIVLCARSAHFTPAYSTLGLTPDGGMSWLLPRLVGLRKAQEIILTNRRVAADEAADLGMVTRVIDDADLLEEGLTIARNIADGPAHALGLSRLLLNEAMEAGLADQLHREAVTIAAAAGSPDARQRLARLIG